MSKIVNEVVVTEEEMENGKRRLLIRQKLKPKTVSYKRKCQSGAPAFTENMMLTSVEVARFCLC